LAGREQQHQVPPMAVVQRVHIVVPAVCGVVVVSAVAAAAVVVVSLIGGERVTVMLSLADLR